MGFKVRFVETPNDPLAVIDVPAAVLKDELGARRLRIGLSRSLGSDSVVLRAEVPGGRIFNGPAHLHRYAADPVVDVLLAVKVVLEPPELHAA